MTTRNMTTIDGGGKDFESRCKPFAGCKLGWYRVRVRDNGDVLVWDDAAGHYTRCHSLSDSAQARMRKLARN